MGKVRIASLESAPISSEPLDGEGFEGGVLTHDLFSGSRTTIHARMHHLSAGQSVSWPETSGGYLVYVWEGLVECSGTPLSEGSMILVEHGASAHATGSAPTSMLLVFNRPLDSRRLPEKSGGNVHLLPADRVPRKDSMTPDGGIGGAILADSSCPTCGLWLHESTFAPGYEVALHRHNEDEVIVVADGDILLGSRAYGRGTAIFVAENTVYGFRSGPEGLRFLNFRASQATYALARSTEFLDEQQIFAKTVGHPQYF